MENTFKGSKGAPEGLIQIEGAGKYNNVCLVPLIAVTKEECWVMGAKETRGEGSWSKVTNHHIPLRLSPPSCFRLSEGPHQCSSNVTDWSARWTVKIKRMTNMHAAYTALGANPPPPPPGLPFEDLLPRRTHRRLQTPAALSLQTEQQQVSDHPMAGAQTTFICWSLQHSRGWELLIWIYY